MKKKLRNKREEFLMTFVQGLIKTYPPSTELTTPKKIEAEKPMQPSMMRSETFDFEEEPAEMTREQIGQKYKPSISASHALPAPSFAPSIKPEQKTIQIGYVEPQKFQKPAAEKITLEKLTPLLRDPTVRSLECPGPERNIIVYRSGSIQATSIKLANAEIESIMEDISERTRIPLKPSGLFKAAYKNLLFVAITSELLGARFIIKKRMPKILNRPAK